MLRPCCVPVAPIVARRASTVSGCRRLEVLLSVDTCGLCCPAPCPFTTRAGRGACASDAGSFTPVQQDESSGSGQLVGMRDRPDLPLIANAIAGEDAGAVDPTRLDRSTHTWAHVHDLVPVDPADGETSGHYVAVLDPARSLARSFAARGDGTPVRIDVTDEPAIESPNDDVRLHCRSLCAKWLSTVWTDMCQGSPSTVTVASTTPNLASMSSRWVNKAKEPHSRTHLRPRRCTSSPTVHLVDETGPCAAQTATRPHPWLSRRAAEALLPRPPQR